MADDCFSLLYTIPLCRDTTIYSSILIMMNVWNVFSSEVLQLVLL